MRNSSTHPSVPHAGALSLLLASILAPALVHAQDPGPMPPRGFAQGKVVHVDAGSGQDTPECGRTNAPCRTINHGVDRAEQVQDDPVAGDAPAAANVDLDQANLITVQVGPGTYNERVFISNDWIRLLGAGPGSSIITAGTEPDPDDWANTPLLIRGGNPVWVEGFTFTQSAIGMGVRNHTQVFIRDCAFDENVHGINVGFSSSVYITDSTFTDNNTGLRVVADGHATLIGVSISAQESGIGIVVSNDSSVLYQSAGGAVPNSISGTSFAVAVFTGSTAEMTGVTVTDNGFGYFVSEDSFLRTYGGEVSDHTGIGVFLDAFSTAIIDSGTVFSGNVGGDIVPDPTSDFDVRP